MILSFWVSGWECQEMFVRGHKPIGKDMLANNKVEVKIFYFSFNLSFWAKWGDTFLSLPFPLSLTSIDFLN